MGRLEAYLMERERVSEHLTIRLSTHAALVSLEVGS